jgi:hypothetical protein
MLAPNPSDHEVAFLGSLLGAQQNDFRAPQLLRLDEINPVFCLVALALVRIELEMHACRLTTVLAQTSPLDFTSEEFVSGLVPCLIFLDNPGRMSVTEAAAEVFMTAFKALKRPEREAVLQKLVSDAQLAEDLAGSVALEARRHQSHQPLRDVLKDLRIRV